MGSITRRKKFKFKAGDRVKVLTGSSEGMIGTIKTTKRTGKHHISHPIGVLFDKRGKKHYWYGHGCELDIYPITFGIGFYA